MPTWTEQLQQLATNERAINEHLTVLRRALLDTALYGQSTWRSSWSPGPNRLLSSERLDPQSWWAVRGSPIAQMPLFALSRCFKCDGTMSRRGHRKVVSMTIEGTDCNVICNSCRRNRDTARETGYRPLSLQTLFEREIARRRERGPAWQVCAESNTANSRALNPSPTEQISL
jgi:hypothetical protein